MPERDHDSGHANMITSRRVPALAVAGGLALLTASFVWDVLFAGIPYQDPTPALAEQYNFHAGVAAAIAWTGLVLVAAGIALAIVHRLRRGGESGDPL